jgi:phage terminase large subunit-like protein
MNHPTKMFRDLTYQGLILHEDNPLLNWCVGNAIAKIDHNENIMLDKSKSSNRIDLLVSCVIGFSRALSASLEDAKTKIANNFFSSKDFSF